MERGRALVLIGFMGTGKSAAGRAIARKLALPRFDIDEMVAAEFGRPIAEIFAQQGEAAFRAAEARVLQQLSETVPAVIVTGGGVILLSENRSRLQELGAVIRLAADEETIFERISRRKSRPLLQTENPRATVHALLQEREPLYAAAADATIDTSDLSHDQTSEAVMACWNAVVAAQTEPA